MSITGRQRSREPPEELRRRFFAQQRAIDNRVVVRVGGDCDAATLDRLNATLEAAIGQRPEDILVDLSEATFVDSLTLGSLTAAAKRVRATGASFGVRGVAGEVRRAFEITGLDKYLLQATRK